MKIIDIRKGYAQMNGGVWVGDIPMPLFDGIRLKVRRLWNPDYAALHEKLMAAQKEPDPEDPVLVNQCLVEACLLDWDGVEDAYSIETARQMMNDPDFGSVFRSAVIWAATRVADRVAAQLKADEKN